MQISRDVRNLQIATPVRKMREIGISASFFKIDRFHLRRNKSIFLQCIFWLCKEVKKCAKREQVKKRENPKSFSQVFHCFFTVKRFRHFSHVQIRSNTLEIDYFLPMLVESINFEKNDRNADFPHLPGYVNNHQYCICDIWTYL